MPNDDDRHYLLKLLSTGLLGKNPDELFHIFTGSGRNGKSNLTELIKLTLGNYFDIISSTFLTAKLSSPDSPSPHLFTLKNKRLVIGSEPDQQFKLNSTLIKSLSGNDDITGRKLYGHQEKFHPYFKMILLCNDIPEIDMSDKAIWMRCRCLSFPTSFVSNPTESHEKLIDENLSSKLVTWKLAFFHLLNKYFMIYLSEGLKMTPNMLERTYDYKKQTDVYLQWLSERTVKADTNIHINILYSDFTEWFQNEHKGSKLPKSSQFTKGLNHHITVKKNIRINNLNRQGVENLKLIDKQSFGDL